MKFIADEGVDAPIVSHLRYLGYSVWYVAEMAAGAIDEDILTLAHSEAAILITADKDFGNLVYLKRQASAGVILLRLAGLTARQKAEAVEQLVNEHGDQLAGAFAVITPNRVRIRPVVRAD